MVKEVKILDKVKEPVKNGYYIEIHFMFGDADGYQVEEMGPFKEDEIPLLHEAIDTVKRCCDAYPEGRAGDDEYNHIEGFDRWFGDDYDNLEEQAIEMVYEPDGWGTQATFEYFKVFYYKRGTKYNCEVVYDGKD